MTDHRLPGKLLELRGSRKSRRRVDPDCKVIPEAVPDEVTAVGPQAVLCWTREIVPLIRAGLVQYPDVGQAIEACRMWQTITDCDEVLAREGMTVQTKFGEHQNQHWRIRCAAHDRYAARMAALGANALARAKCGTPASSKKRPQTVKEALAE